VTGKEEGTDTGETESGGKGKVCSRCGGPFAGSEPVVLDHYSYDQSLMGAEWTWRHQRCRDAGGRQRG
jgi:hypothetical protein